MDEMMAPSPDGLGDRRRSFELVRFEQEGPVVRVTLNRPAVNNAMNIRCLEEIDAALERVDMDREAKIVVFRGEGSAFSSGLDIADHTEEKAYQIIDAFHRVIRRVMELEAVSISVVQGMALGGGCELAASCDFCFAAEDAKLGQPEIKAGIFPSVAAVLYPRLIGLRRTFEMILTGRIYGAREAERIGLISRAVAADDLDGEVAKWIEFLKGFSAPVLQFARRAVSDTFNLPFEEGMRHVEEIYLNQLMDTEDAKEGLKALLERRKPVWKNR